MWDLCPGIAASVKTSDPSGLGPPPLSHVSRPGGLTLSLMHLTHAFNLNNSCGQALGVTWLESPAPGTEDNRQSGRPVDGRTSMSGFWGRCSKVSQPEWLNQRKCTVSQSQVLEAQNPGVCTAGSFWQLQGTITHASPSIRLWPFRAQKHVTPVSVSIFTWTSLPFSFLQRTVIVAFWAPSFRMFLSQDP